MNFILILLFLFLGVTLGSFINAWFWRVENNLYVAKGRSMKRLKNKGFTIIEVIIVLVIGAVIMLAVFLVIPQLQRNSRNSQRMKDIQRVLVAARQYYGSNTFNDTTANSSAAAADVNNIKNIFSTNFNDPS